MSGQLSQRLGEVFSVMQEEHPPSSSLHKERNQRSVGFGRIAVPAGEHQVVRPVIGRLTAAGPNVVERDGVIVVSVPQYAQTGPC